MIQHSIRKHILYRISENVSKQLANHGSMWKNIAHDLFVIQPPNKINNK